MMNVRRMTVFTMMILFLIIPLYFSYKYLLQVMMQRGVHRPDVLIITIDTLQADAVGSYGNPQVYTPFIDALSRKGTLFPRGYAPVPTTGSSHTTIFTGCAPSKHRVFRNAMKYSNEFKTAAKIFHDFHYQTAAFVSGYSLTARMCGLESGFDLYDDGWSEKQLERDAAATVDACIRWLKTIDDSKPCFIWIHLFDPHAPYQERDPFLKALRDQSAIISSEIPASEEQIRRYAEHTDKAIQAQDYMVLVKNPMTTQTDPETLSGNWTAYLSEISYVDLNIQKLKRYLLNINRWDRMLTLVTADHGEGFDHEYFYAHGDRLWESATRVPWIVRLPHDRIPNQIAKAIARHEDILPTILSLSYLSIPLTGLDGVDLKNTIELNTTGATSSWITLAPPLPRKGLSNGLVIASYDQFFKLIRTVDTQEEKLFQVSDDPGETVDLSNQYPQIRDRLSKQINRNLQKSRYPREVEFDPGEIREKEKLQTLGYIQ